MSKADLASRLTELEAANCDLENLLASTNVAAILLDANLRVRRFTPAATRLFSLIPGDTGRPIQDIARKFLDPTLLSDLAAALDQPATLNTEVQSWDGQWYVRQVLPYRTIGQQTDGVVITFSDVAAEALQKAREYAESIVDTVREPLLVLDQEMRVCSANQSFYAAFDASPEGTVGQVLFDLGRREWDVPELRTLLAEILPEQHVVNDFELVRDFGSIGTRTVVLNARAIVNDDRPDKILLAIEDMTERIQAEQALQRSEAREQADELVRQRQGELAHALRISTIGEMASNLAHELNQPLSSIANRVEACAEYVRSGRMDSAGFLELLDEASSDALRAGSIVEHVRSFIQEREPQFEPADLGEIVRGIPRLFERQIQLEGLTLQLDSGREPLPVHADRVQIEQVVVNLVQNAIEAVCEGAAEQRTIQLRTRAMEGQARLSVSDNGPGLPADATERLFDPFFTTKPKGLGMGLAISRSIVEAHQGRIWVDCPTDGSPGATLCITLPLWPSVARTGRSA
jgi:two-component system CheB/CheR fusion protein